MTPPDSVQGAVRGLFAALGRGDWKSASTFVSDPVDVFGASAPREAFAAGTDKRLGSEVTAFASVPTAFFTGVEHGVLFGGPVPEGAHLCFATATVDGTPATYGLVVVEESDGPRVLRLFDPAAFKTFAASLDAARRGVEQVTWT